MNRNQTIKYYNKNAQAYYDKTVNVDMSELCDRFLDHIKDGGVILDIGCGSGRDMRYFIEKGYHAEGLDASSEMCRLAGASSLSVENVPIEEWNPRKKYDGIWANASLLHVTISQIYTFFIKAEACMDTDGALFASMKTGLTNDIDADGRYFCPFSEEKLEEILIKHPAFLLCDKWYSDDKLGRNTFRWFHFILARK